MSFLRIFLFAFIFSSLNVLMSSADSNGVLSTKRDSPVTQTFSSEGVLTTSNDGIIATEEKISTLRNDLRNNRLKVGVTRLEHVIHTYGESNKKFDGDKIVTLEYNDLKIDFDKKKYWREWKTSSKKPAYTDKINLLRKKLSGQKIEGKNIPLEKFIKDYDEPTEIELETEDGKLSKYYWGEMMLTFENVYTLKKWEAKSLMPPKVAETTAMKNNDKPKAAGSSQASK